MDPTPFLRISMDDITDADAEQLFRFRHDKFKPEALHPCGRECIYLFILKSYQLKFKKMLILNS